MNDILTRLGFGILSSVLCGLLFYIAAGTIQWIVSGKFAWYPGILRLGLVIMIIFFVAGFVTKCES